MIYEPITTSDAPAKILTQNLLNKVKRNNDDVVYFIDYEYGLCEEDVSEWCVENNIVLNKLIKEIR
jgi:hypothetical protein